jgi:hypothetical protein
MKDIWELHQDIHALQSCLELCSLPPGTRRGFESSLREAVRRLITAEKAIKAESQCRAKAGSKG